MKTCMARGCPDNATQRLRVRQGFSVFETCLAHRRVLEDAGEVVEVLPDYEQALQVRRAVAARREAAAAERAAQDAAHRAARRAAVPVGKPNPTRAQSEAPPRRAAVPVGKSTPTRVQSEAPPRRAVVPVGKPTPTRAQSEVPSRRGRLARTPLNAGRTPKGAPEVPLLCPAVSSQEEGSLSFLGATETRWPSVEQKEASVLLPSFLSDGPTELTNETPKDAGCSPDEEGEDATPSLGEGGVSGPMPETPKRVSKGAPPTKPIDKARVLAHIRARTPAKVVAAEFGVTPSTLFRRMAGWGLSFTPRLNPGGAPALSIDLQAVLAQRASGQTVAAIAAGLGVSRATLSRRLSAAGFASAPSVAPRPLRVSTAISRAQAQARKAEEAEAWAATLGTEGPAFVSAPLRPLFVQAVRLQAEGRSRAAIAARLKIGSSTVSRWLRQAAALTLPVAMSSEEENKVPTKFDLEAPSMNQEMSGGEAAVPLREEEGLQAVMHRVAPHVGAAFRARLPEALTRAAAGESIAHIARAMEIAPTTIGKWVRLARGGSTPTVEAMSPSPECAGGSERTEGERTGAPAAPDRRCESEGSEEVGLSDSEMRRIEAAETPTDRDASLTRNAATSETETGSPRLPLSLPLVPPSPALCTMQWVLGPETAVSLALSGPMTPRAWLLLHRHLDLFQVCLDEEKKKESS